ncbi:MAG: OB-fold nucleic acid binding domain-containing protein, partial [Nanoarchaeota archaeon]
EKLANYFYEKKLLGYSYSHTLKSIYIEKEPDLISINQVFDHHDNSVIFIGTVEEKRELESKKKKKYVKMKISDETGAVDVILFDFKIEDCRAVNNNKLPEEEDIVIIRGQKKDNVVFADNIGIQTQKIYTRLNELKSDIKEENDSKSNIG